MFFKIIQLIQMILAFILENEWLFPTAAGAEKKEAVMKSTAAELRRQGMLSGDDESADNAVLEHLGNVVDGAVGIFNAKGVFKRAAIASTPPAPAPEPEPLPVTPPDPPDPNPPSTAAEPSTTPEK